MRICWSLYQQSDVFVVGKVLGEATVGIYSLAMDIATVAVNKISTVISQVAAPVMAEVQNDVALLRGSLLRGIRLTAWITFPVCVGMMLVADDLVRFVLTDRWAAVVPIIELLCPYALVRSIAVLLPPVLMARFRTRLLLGFNVTLLAIMPLAFWVGARTAGVIGVAAVWVVVYPAMLIPIVSRALVEVRANWALLGLELWRPTIATAVMGASVLIVRYIPLAPQAGQPLLRLGAMVVVGTVSYLLALFFIGGSAVGEMKEMSGWLLRRGRIVPTPAGGAR